MLQPAPKSTVVGSLVGKTAIITGGSRGIGFAIATTFARLGAHCYLVARHSGRVRSAAALINSTAAAYRPAPDAPDGSPSSPSAPPRPDPTSLSGINPPPFRRADEGEPTPVRFIVPASLGSAPPLHRGPPGDESLSPPSHPMAMAIVGDVSRQETWDHIVAKVRSPDILVNAAGISQKSLFHRTTLEDLDSILDNNLRSTMLGCRAVSQLMIKRASTVSRRGRLNIINVSSVMASRSQTGAAAYSASKAGILGKLPRPVSRVAPRPRPSSDMSPSIRNLGLTTSLSQELGHFGIRVNAILPGYINTDMVAGE